MQSETSNPYNTLSRERIRLMLMMRRMVREEFGVTVPLSDEAAADELLAFASRARNSLLRQMARELEGHLVGQENSSEETADAAPSRYYRGAAIPTEEDGTAARSDDSHSKPRRVYRGQVIE